MREKIIYYKNELEDEFSTACIKAKKIGDDYNYLGGPLRFLGRFIFYYGLARPMGFLFIKIKYGHKIVNRKVLKEAKGKGYFMYGNHTNAGADPFIPQSIDVNNSVYFICNADNVSMPVLGKITPSLGALPLPDTLGAARSFSKVIEKRCAEGSCILVYPEAHIWPYYTGIRPFKNASFGYPIQCDAPVYCFTNTYQKRKFFKTPRMVTYVDGPFTCDKEAPKSVQKQQLRDAVYEKMKERSKNSNVTLVKYIKEEDA